MDFLTLEELREPDETSFVFGPLGGFDPWADRAAAVLEHRQRTISGTDLVAEVPDSVRQNFDRLRVAYAYGVLCYDLFTVVEQATYFLLEHALGERVLEQYECDLPLVNKKKREVKPLVARSFREVNEAFRDRRGSHSKGEWALPAPDGQLFRFTASLTNLLTWARLHGLLDGQRGRWGEEHLVKSRNYAAHLAGHELHSPADAAEAIRDVGEVINRLWGARTPGGRLYPAPVERVPIAIGWKETGDQWTVTQARNLPVNGDDDWSYLIIRGVFYDEMLTSFATDFELTTFPTEWLWGPGSHREAIGWLELHQPQADSVDYLDRKLLVRVRGNDVELPRRPETAASISDDTEGDEWHLVLADHPLIAHGHVRVTTSGSGECIEGDPCPCCQAHTVAKGTLDEVLEYVGEHYATVEPEPLSGIAVPGYRSPLVFG